MIKEISGLQSANKKAFATPKNANKINGASLMTQSQENVMSYSLSNLKANYVSFTGENLKDVAQKKESIGSQEPGLFEVKRIKASTYVPENMMSRPDRELMSGNYYSKVADEVVISLGSDKNVLMPFDENVTPEIFTHNFVKNIKSGNYHNMGLNIYNTSVFTLSPHDIPATEGESFRDSFFKTLGNLSRKHPHKKQIFFVKDFEDLLASIAGAKDYENIFNRETFEAACPNAQIVGFIPKSELKLKTAEDIMRGNTPKFDPQRLKYVRKVELNGLGAKDTKTLLKSDVRFIKNILNGYDMGRFDLEPNVIDKIVDRTAFQYAGAFPRKATDVLDLIAATELAETKKGDGLSEVKIKLTPDKVDKFFENHSDLLKPFKMDESVFSFAQNIKTKFADVGGATEAKEELQKIAEFAKDPKKYLKKFPMMSAPKGAILEGPTGTGKTLLAMAVAGEVDVPFSSMSAAELLKKYIGEGEEAVREWFKKLDQAATDSGKGVAVGFIDEIDAIGTIRSSTPDAGSEAKTSILNQLLTLVDGFNNKHAKNKIILIAATNRADILDPALKRAGRFDKVISVGNAETFKETLEILSVHTQNLPFPSETSKAETLDELAQLLKGSSGADIKQVVDITKEVVSQRPENRVITFNDTFEALLQSMMGKKRISEMTIEQKRQVAIHEAGHALVRDFFDMPLTAVSNEERGKYGGVTIANESSSNPSFISVIKELAAKSAGGDAEALYYSHGHDAGVSQDLKQATAMIDSAIRKWGLGVNAPQLSLVNNEHFNKMYEKESKMDADLFLNTRREVSRKIVGFYKEFLDSTYLKRYDEEMASGKGGSVYLGKEFRAMREAWLDSSGKRAEFDALRTKMETFIADAQKVVKTDAVVETAEQAVKNVSHFKPIAIGAASAIALAGVFYAGISSSNCKKTAKA